MSARPPKLAFSRLAAPPPAGTIQFYDGYFPALLPGSYTIGITHTITPLPPQNAIAYEVGQSFVVMAPQFTLDPGLVQMQYPPPGGGDCYGADLPFLTMTDPALPWERALAAGGAAAGNAPANPLPWMALVLLADDEVILPRNANNPVVTSTVRGVIEPDPFGAVLKPDISPSSVAASLLDTRCQTVVIPGDVFAAVMPTLADLPFLAHCRAVNTPDEAQALLSVVLANRLPLATGGPRRYYAHLVSLEGFAAYLGPAARPIPQGPGGRTMNVQMVSLFNWTFVSLPQTGLDFEQLMGGLIASEASSPVLALPPAAVGNLPEPVQGRIQDGYSALTFVTGAGEESFAWYRGPFSPVVPQPLPPVGAPGVPVGQARTADALMIYLAEQGLFDLSYAAAWNIGRALGLADAAFAQAVRQLGLAAGRALGRLTQRLVMPHFARENDLAGLLAPDATRARFKRLIGEGLGRRWTAAVKAGRGAAGSAAVRRGARARARLHPRDVLARPDVQRALAEHVGSLIEPIVTWLVDLILLYPVPFSHLVPDGRMLPAESVRFFYVDSAWLEALIAGALSIQIRTGRDLAIHQVLRPAIDAAVATRLRQHAVRGAPRGATDGPPQLTGVLIRSQVVSRWPALAVSASVGGAPLPVVRDDRPAPYVRLTLFDGIPDTVRLAEPYQGLRFGIEDNGVAARYVTASGPTGEQIPDVFVPPAGEQFIDVFCRPPVGQATGGVIEVATLAAALVTATGAPADTFGAGNFALQMVKAPEMQPFVAASGIGAR